MTFKRPFEKEKIREILKIIKRHKLLFNLVRQNDHMTLSKIMGSDIKTLGSDFKIMNKKVNETNVEITNIQITERHKKIRQ